MGRYGLSELPAPPVEVVGLMTHLATADSDAAFARAQIERFRAATDAHAHLTRHVANSAAALRLPESRFDAARCGIALYGLSPFGEDPAGGRARARAALAEPPRAGEAAAARREHRLRPPLRRRASRPGSGSCPSATRDGFRRDLTGTEVRVGGRAAAGASGPSRWTRSRSSSTASCPLGTPVVARRPRRARWRRTRASPARSTTSS